jgi:hypothetical protein
MFVASARQERAERVIAAGHGKRFANDPEFCRFQRCAFARRWVWLGVGIRSALARPHPNPGQEHQTCPTFAVPTHSQRAKLAITA